MEKVFEYSGIFGIPQYVLIFFTFVFVITLFICYRNRKSPNAIKLFEFLSLVEIIMLTLSCTLLFRPIKHGFLFKTEIMSGFMEYYRDGIIPYENILNIILFIPIGYLISSLIASKKNNQMIAIFSGILFSLFIESMQYIFKRGIFDINDILNNTLGSIFGCLLYSFFKNRTINLTE